jgi:transcriptional regulator with XRE-family HTH domain
MKVDGKLIRTLREGKKLQATQLAQRVEITPQFLSDIERGHRGVNPETVARIAEILEVDVAQIMPPETKGQPAKNGAST